MVEIFEFRAAAATPERLDRLLTAKLTTDRPAWALSRAQIKHSIEAGLVSVGDKILTKAGAMVNPGSPVVFRHTPTTKNEIAPYDLPLNILFEDASVLVINKPSGLTMHPGAGRPEETLVNAVQSHLLRSGVSLDEGEGGVRPGIVHRLDHDTTGVVVVAKDRASLWALARQFAARTTGRTYESLVFTTPRSRRKINLEETGVIDLPLGRHPKQRTKIAVRPAGSGRRAVTHWAVAERFVYGTLLNLRLETGRTHQIRVHLDSIGSPVVGDRSYGDFSGLPHTLAVAADQFGRQALHAYKLEFDHPVSGARLSFCAPRPADFEKLVQEFRAWTGH